MSLIDHNSVPEQLSRDGSAIRKTIISAENGAESIHLQDVVTVGRGAVPAHTHTHEESITVIEGEVAFTIGDQRFVATAGHTILIPTGVVHSGEFGAGARLIEFYPIAHPVVNFA